MLELQSAKKWQAIYGIIVAVVAGVFTLLGAWISGRGERSDVKPQVVVVPIQQSPPKDGQ